MFSLGLIGREDSLGGKNKQDIRERSEVQFGHKGLD